MSVAQEFNTAKRRVYRKRPDAGAPPTPPVVALVLVSAAYDPDAATLTLVFDRAINIDAFDGTGLTVDDGEFLGRRFDGTGGSDQPTPQSVRVNLLDFGSSIEAGVHLTVEAGNGIVAADDSSPWEGCTDLELPYP